MFIQALTQLGEFRFKAASNRTGFGHQFFLTGDLGFDLRFLDVERMNRRLQLAQLGGQFEEFLVTEMGVENFDIDRQRLVASGLGDLSAQRVHASFLLGEHVAHAQQVRLGVLQLAHGLLFLALVLGDPGGFFKHRATFLGLGRKDLIDLALRHDRVSGATNARVHEQVVDVLESAKRVVDAILRLSIAEHAAGDRDFIVIDLQRFLAIGHGQGDFRHALSLALFRAVENDIGHLPTAQSFGRSFSENPANGIDDIRFAAAIRADDPRHTRGEFKDGLVRKRLEAVNFERFEIHRSRSGVSPKAPPVAQRQAYLFSKKWQRICDASH